MDAAEKEKAKKSSPKNKQGSNGVNGGGSVSPKPTEDVRPIETLLKFIGEPAGVVGNGKKKAR